MSRISAPPHRCAGGPDVVERWRKLGRQRRAALQRRTSRVPGPLVQAQQDEARRPLRSVRQPRQRDALQQPLLRRLQVHNTESTMLRYTQAQRESKRRRASQKVAQATRSGRLGIRV